MVLHQSTLRPGRCVYVWVCACSIWIVPSSVSKSVQPTWWHWTDVRSNMIWHFSALHRLNRSSIQVSTNSRKDEIQVFFKNWFHADYETNYELWIFISVEMLPICLLDGMSSKPTAKRKRKHISMQCMCLCEWQERERERERGFDRQTGANKSDMLLVQYWCQSVVFATLCATVVQCSPLHSSTRKENTERNKFTIFLLILSA